MRSRFAALGAMAVLVGACAGQTENIGGGGGDDTAGATTVTSGGGEGGATVAATTTTSSGGACSQDCSLIDTPDCFIAACNEATGACEVIPADGASCDDGLFCTLGETCQNGTCKGGVQNTCGINPAACVVVTCDEASQACGQIPGGDGLACTISDDLCVVNAQCQNGLCVGAQKDCFFAPMPDVCHVGVCNPATGVCDPTVGNEGGSCPNDGDLCMVNKVCTAGACLGGTPKDCSSATNGCNLGTCDPVDGTCFGAPIPPGGMCGEATNECNTGFCDNNGICNPTPNPGVLCASGTNECNTGVCDVGGACVAIPNPGVACASANDDCNVGVCDALGACAPVPTNEGLSCDDGNMCTLGEACVSGACTGGTSAGYEVYFSEPFAGNSAGWTLGPEWAIGPAMASVGNPTGNQDPAMDHTATADNGIAGVVIGGYASTAMHAQYYLTSPVIDTSMAAATVYLEFERWLNSDYTRYMKNTIDVFNGTTWVNVWASAGPPAIQDATWTHQSYDITAHKNAAMQVRFGFDIGSAGVFTVSGWNIDDVVIANLVCGP